MEEQNSAPLGATTDRLQDQASVPFARRTLLRLGAVGAAGAGITTAGAFVGPSLARRGLLNPDGVFSAAGTALGDTLFYVEAFPTSPLILEPFKDRLSIPKALEPEPESSYLSWTDTPGPGDGRQNSMRNERHQKWPNEISYPDPLVYKIELLVRGHSFTTSKVLPITRDGLPAKSFDADGKIYREGEERTLPVSTIYGFNGTFPGPMINAEYGKPVLIRFINSLDENPFNLDRQDFGAPDASFLTHLHNAHTAPESDGNPHYSMVMGPKKVGYETGTWVDNLYLNWPAGHDDREKQSFFWFHDHRMDHTGANVYKGMVGLYPIYDPKNGMDMGDERRGLRLPGVRKDHSDGSFDVDYDIPLAFFDARLDDGVTVHQDIHDGEGDYPDAHNPSTHPEWWGKTFFKHFPNHGFVGDIFTVNGTAFPVMEVKRRKYRFRFLDASVARIYDFQLMSSTQGPKSAVSLGYKDEDLQGQYRIEDGQQCMKFTQIASDGGLLPFPIERDNFELWPAKRREVVIDFTRYQDGTPTTKGDVVYLTNVMKMPDGRMWSKSNRFSPDPRYKVPVLKFVIGDLAEDNSQIPQQMRALPPLPSSWKSMMDNRSIFEVQRGGAGGEVEWLINGQPFTPDTVAASLKNPSGKRPLAIQKKGSFNLWEIRNGGGGWVHPFHLHMEEHRTVMRNGKDVTQRPDAGHPDDISREDLVALDPGESVIIYRGFRDFVGPYVAHCHNLAHEDHAMMFGWAISP
ncbi:multicopper oxidase family protein [Nocardioides aestuarii]|uniref:Multicopper oxidase CueO n=1 Tax=Nocardioides aestuarii TaxID=252231 RepID=A0ABW4TN47_9ACTN